MPKSKATKTTQPRQRTTGGHGPVDHGKLFQIGEVLADTYEIRSVLGSGGMGQVFDAKDRVLNRRVAIKAHWPHLHAFPIRTEAQALAAIRHPSVVTVYGVGKHAGVEFMVMERILGVTLAERLERVGGKLPIGEAIDLLARLADALGAVHEAGIAHRDVKPANVMLAARDRLVLTDFGIFLAEFTNTSSDYVPGTAEYMAPEAIARTVARGGAYLVDVYAFGVVAFEMLIGHRPFSAPTVHELLDKQLREPAPPIALLRTDIPPRLARLIDSALSKDPVERPVSMESIASTLRAPGTAERPPRPISVLIAEDDAPIARVLEEFVVDLAPDAHVRVARDGEAALAHVRQAQPDLLLLDIGLPTMNGIELCMHLRGGELARNTSIVAMSASAQPRDLAILKQLGIKSFIRKGGDWLARVEDAVASARAVPRSVAPV